MHYYFFIIYESSFSRLNLKAIIIGKRNLIVIDFEDSSDEAQFKDALVTILQSDSDEKETTFIKQEIKREENQNPKMSVSHTPTTQAGAGAVRRPPPPPASSGQTTPQPPQDGATGGQPPPGQQNTGTSQKTGETGMPQTLESCKIAFNNAVDQFNSIQEKILLFSHHLKLPLVLECTHRRWQPCIFILKFREKQKT